MAMGAADTPNRQEAEGEKRAASSSARRPKWPWIVALCALIVLLGAGVWWTIVSGTWAPPGMAAKYGAASYVTEQEVEDYIGTYRRQMGLADCSDEEWATFLAANGLTPDKLRSSTIYNLLVNHIVTERAAERGITVSDEELDDSLEALKDMVAFNDEATWQETLASFGQTEEGLRETYRLEGLKQKLCLESVPRPEPTDAQMQEALSAYVAQADEGGTEVKHSFCLRMPKGDAEGSLDERQVVQRMRDEFAAGEKSQEILASLAQAQGATVEDTGWNVDIDTYAADYQKALDELEEGAVSNVLADDESYYVIWVDQAYDVSVALEEVGDSAKATSGEGQERSTAQASEGCLETLPSSLAQYFTDRVASALWQTESDAYIEQLVADASPVYFSLPENASYNVDMALASNQNEEEVDQS